MMETKEIYKIIPGFAGYQVSNLGSVKSFRRRNIRILKPGVNQRGYKVANILRDDGKCKRVSVHQLVAMAFLGHERRGMKSVVDHIDDNKLNNCVENLRIVTNRENVSYRGGSSEYVGVSFDKRRRNKWCARITIDGKRKFLGRFKNEYDAHLKYQNELKKIKDGY